MKSLPFVLMKGAAMYRRAIIVLVLAGLAALTYVWADNTSDMDENRYGRVDVQTERVVSERRLAMPGIPWRINYQGYLTDDVGNAVNDTLVLRFRIYDSPVGGTELWGALRLLVIEDGLFNVILGDLDPIPSTVFEAGEPRWLELEVDSQIMSPRTQITSVGFAYRSHVSGEALSADSVDGFNASAAPGPDDLFPLSFGETQYVNEGQIGAVTSAMVLDGSLLRSDVVGTFKAPFADTANYAFAANVGHVDSARVSANSWRLEDHTLVDLDSIWVNEGQVDGITSGMILDGTLKRSDAADTFKAPYADTADYALNAVTDNDWIVSGSVLFPDGEYGLAMDPTGALYGDSTHSHVNLGVACTTGLAGAHYRYCTVGGGWRNRASGVASVVGGGYINSASGHRGTVGGGESNLASEWYATVGGGERNSATARQSIIAGGYLNSASGLRSAVGGGYADTAAGHYATISGGYANRATTDYATCGGGYLGLASGLYSTLGGGNADTATGDYSTVSGGIRNRAGGAASTIAGGSSNSASGDAATVSGGYQNTASSLYATVGGGWSNTAGGDQAAVSGGKSNTASGEYGFVGGGLGNSATAARSTVAGGSGNSAGGPYAVVSGGLDNWAAGQAAVVAGGSADSVAGDYSLAAGRQVVVDSSADYTFAFGRGFTTSTPNAVIFHNTSSPIRVGIGNAAPTHLIDVGGSGAYCDGGNWVDGSSREYKGGISDLTLEQALEAVYKLTPVTYHYKLNPGEECVGFIAEDVPDLVATKDRKGLSPMDIVAVLTRVVQNQQREIEALKSEVETLKAADAER
jgi:hypothetical protein